MDKVLKEIVERINEEEAIFNKTGRLYSSELYADKLLNDEGRASFAIITKGDRQLNVDVNCGDFFYQTNCVLYANFFKLDAPAKAITRLIGYINETGRAEMVSFSNDAGEIFKEIRKSELKTELCLIKIEFNIVEYLPNYSCTECIGEACNNCNCGEQ